MPDDSFSDDLDFGQTIQIPLFGVGQKVFRRYTLQRILGRGGMGVVWLARDERLESFVALKVLPETLCHDRASLQALTRETKLGLHLAHPNIVRIFDLQTDDHAAAISMEYVDGATLSDVRTTKPQRVFDPADVEVYLEPLCDALHYAHTRRKIVHRDLKPRNLMLTSDGELKIADFGISRSISESMTLVTGIIGSTGSPPYISPQQWDGEQPTPLDDIYSVGATLYELLTSKPPLLGVVDWQQVHSKIPPPIWKRRLELGITGVAAVSAAWEETIAACLAKDPKDRPQTMRDLQTRLASNGASDVSTVERVTRPSVPHVEQEAAEERDRSEPLPGEITLQDLSDDTVTLTRALVEPQLDVLPQPAIDIIAAPPASVSSRTIDDPTPAEAEKGKVDGQSLPSPEPEPPSSPPIPQEPVAEPKHLGAVAVDPVISAPNLGAAPTLSDDTIIADPRATLTDPCQGPSAAHVLPNKELDGSILPRCDAECSGDAPIPAPLVAEPPRSVESYAIAPIQETAATLNEPMFAIPEAESPFNSEAITVAPRKAPRWVWGIGAAAAFLLSGILLISKPGHGRGPASPAHSQGAVQTQTGAVARTASSAKETDNRSLGRPTPAHAAVRTDLVPPALSSAASSPARSAPPVANASVAAATPAIEAASPASSSATATWRAGIAPTSGSVLSPSGTPVLASTASGVPPVQDFASAPSPLPALAASREVLPAPNSPPAVAGSQNIPPATHHELTSSPKENAPAFSDRPATGTKAELRSRKSEKIAKRSRRESTAPRRVDAAAPWRAGGESPTPSAVPVRKRAPQPFEGGVPGG